MIHPAPEELANCLSIVDLFLDDVRRAVPGIEDAATFVGLAGTVSTAAAVEIGLATYDRDRIHHFVLTKDAVEDVFRTLATEPLADRVHNPGLERERADVIVGGLCVLVSIMRRWWPCAVSSTIADTPMSTSFAAMSAAAAEMPTAAATMSSSLMPCVARR